MAGSNAPRPRKNKDTLHNEVWLRGKYLDERLSANDIAALVDCSQPTVLWALRKFGIPARSASESKRGRPNNTVWTPEMRASLAAKRRGENNPMFGTVSPNRGHYKNEQPSRNTGRALAQRLYGEQPCVVCGTLPVERHHIDGDTMNNEPTNIEFYCRPHHATVGHKDGWGGRHPKAIAKRATTRQQVTSKST
jgi:hypothetical protein